MEKYVIEGGLPLKGEVTIGGAKNAVVAIMPATILANGPCVIENIPDISDVAMIMKILEQMGAKVQTLSGNSIMIDTSYITSYEVPTDLARKLRASYYFLGALLARFKKAVVPMPGGCDFGVRPIDQHVAAFEAIGSKCEVEFGLVKLEAEELMASHIYFDVVTVGATINAMLASVYATGTTVIENAAKEPHIVDLANFLNSMGADIMGAGTDVIKIKGVEQLTGTTYSIIPDQIEAGTYMVAAAATRGDITIKNVIPKHLESITSKIEAVGAKVIENDDSIRVIGGISYNRTNVKTLPHPGFPTDMQPQIAVLLCLAEGTSIITEGVWENRFKYVNELRRLGAEISVDGRVAVIEGSTNFTGAPVRASDLRAGAALVIAGLASKGTTEIENISHIERGYENICEKLRELGADIKKVRIPESDIDHAL